MLDRVPTIVLGLDGAGAAESFADYSQWEAWQAQRKQPAKTTGRQTAAAAEVSPTKEKTKKLSYLDAREYAGIEQPIPEAEHALQANRSQLEDPAIPTDGPRLLTAHAEMEAGQKHLDSLYARS